MCENKWRSNDLLETCPCCEVARQPAGTLFLADVRQKVIALYNNLSILHFCLMWSQTIATVHVI